MKTWRRLFVFVRPHASRMAGNIGFSVVAAVLDAFSFSLLVPFLDALFGLPPIPDTGTLASKMLQRTPPGRSPY